MDGSRTRSDGRRLSAAGLIVVTAGTLLMMAWAIFPSPAFADGTYTWGEEDGIKNGAATCANGGHWNMFFDGVITSATLNVGGQSFPMSPQGNHWDADSVGPIDPSTVVTVSWVGAGTAEFLTLSHCAGTPTTSTSPPSTTTEPTTTTSTSTTTSTTTTTSTSTSSTSTSSTPPPTTSTPPPSSSTTVAPTTITPPPDDSETVEPTTVAPPKGTAFTGPENVIPLGVIALTMMTTGSGLLWAGTRRGRREEDRG